MPAAAQGKGTLGSNRMEGIQVTPASSSLVRTTYTVLLYFKVLSILLLEGQQNLGEGYSYHSSNTHITPIPESVLVANALQQILSFFFLTIQVSFGCLS